MINAKTIAAASMLAIAAPLVAVAYVQAVAAPAARVAAVNKPTVDMTEGEVRKIDKDSGKITLKHGEIKNLGMPGMTMVFKVKDAALLDKVQVGSKVRFLAESADGTVFVTALEAAT